MTSENAVAILQVSLAPGLLISAAGLILISLTNRMAKPAAQIRALIKEGSKKDKVKEQIRILYYRAQIMRVAILLLILSTFASVLTVMLIEARLVLNIVSENYIVGFFTLALALLLASLGFYLYDVYLALRGLRIELEANGFLDKK